MTGLTATALLFGLVFIFGGVLYMDRRKDKKAEASTPPKK